MGVERWSEGMLDSEVVEGGVAESGPPRQPGELQPAEAQLLEFQNYCCPPVSI